MLDREIPLSRNRRLHDWIPREHGRPSNRLRLRLESSRRSNLRGIGRRAGRVVVRPSDLGWRIGRVTRQAQIRSGSFQIGRNTVCPANDGPSVQKGRRPRESEARLEISQSGIVAVIQSSAVSVLAHNAARYNAVSGKLYEPGYFVDIDLTIVRFNPRSTG